MAAQCDRAQRIPNPACEACGYSLAGIGAGGDARVCPECGEGFDVAKPWLAAPWPGWPLLWLRLCGPCAVVLGLLLGLSPSRATRNWLVWPLWSVWLPCIVIFGVFWPLTTATRMAATCEPRIARRAVVRRLVGSAWAVNAALVGAAVLAITTLL